MLNKLKGKVQNYQEWQMVKTAGNMEVLLQIIKLSTPYLLILFITSNFPSI